MGDASRCAGSPGAGAPGVVSCRFDSCFDTRESREALFFVHGSFEMPSEDLFAILGYEAELGCELSDCACLMVKAVCLPSSASLSQY